jgi:hypothetical protein
MWLCVSGTRAVRVAQGGTLPFFKILVNM